MKYFYDEPKQVRFYVDAEEGYCGGIAYHDEIICGCCGGIFEIADVVDNTPRGLIPIHEYHDWMDLTGAIMSAGSDITEDDYNKDQLSLFNNVNSDLKN